VALALLSRRKDYPVEFVDVTFDKTTVQLDGNNFTRCTFNQCDLVYSGLAPVNMSNVSFNDCTWRFDGPAAMTLSFMLALYHGAGEGGRQLIEATFDSLRRGQLPAQAEKSALS
jgi:uncharacterized protein YjbI with pentapeptide repeats